MRSFHFVVAILILEVSATAITAQQRVARALSATEQAGAANVSQGQAAIDRAAAAGKYIFIFFYAGQDSQTSTMKGIFDTAMAKMTDRADAIAIYAADPTEKSILDKLRPVQGSQLPPVLALAPTRGCHSRFPQTVW